MTKEEISFINTLDKPWVYEMYEIINYQDIDYEKISKRQMIQEIYSTLLEDDQYLKSTILKSDLNILIEAIKIGQTTIRVTIENKAALHRLRNAFLLFSYDRFSDIYTIPSDILMIFNNYDLLDFSHLLDEFYYFINGLLLTRGKIRIDEAKVIYELVKPKNFDLDFNEALELTVNKITFIDLFDFKHYDMLTSNLISFDLTINEAYPKTNYTFDTFKNFGKYGLDISTEQGAKIYKVISKQLTNNYPNHFMYLFLIDLHNPGKTISNRMVELLIESFDGDFDKGFKMYNELVSIMPRWDFLGTIKKDIRYEDISKFYQNLSEANKVINTCLCGSGLEGKECCENDEKLLNNKAIVNEEQAFLFYSIINDLVYLANQQYQVLKVYNPRTFIQRLSQEDFIKLKDLALANQEIVDIFINEHQKHFDDETKEIIKGIQNSYRANFIALEYNDQKLTIYDEVNDLKFVLSGIVSPLSESISFDQLPAFIETRLIPLNDRIIYDVMINRVPVSIGPNIIKNLAIKTKGTKILNNIDDFEILKLNKYN